MAAVYSITLSRQGLLMQFSSTAKDMTWRRGGWMFGKPGAEL